MLSGLMLLICVQYGLAQESVNQYDANGARHGVWKKFYPESDQVRYQGTFEHGKEVGTFYFYCEDCKDQPAFTKEFNTADNKAVVTHFNSRGKVLSTGTMIGKVRDGTWIYYHNNTTVVMLEESYVNGQLDGLMTTYYENGNKSEELNYSAGVRHGANFYYSPAGVLIKSLNYENDVLQGPVEYYDATGALIIKGQYKDDAKDGLWQYYTNGKLSKEERYPKQNKKQ